MLQDPSTQESTDINKTSTIYELIVQFLDKLGQDTRPSYIPIQMDTGKIEELTDALDIYVKPASQRFLDETYNETSIDLNWQIVSFEYDTLAIQINFKDYLEISPDAI